MTAQPISLAKTAEGSIQITWSDGVEKIYTVRELREACPCATCREKHGPKPPPPLLPVLSPAEARPLTIQGMRPVGNYAYGIEFSDGHDAGIYTLELLHSLGQPKRG